MYLAVHRCLCSGEGAHSCPSPPTSLDSPRHTHTIRLQPACPVCHVDLTIDLEAPALELDESATIKARQGILGRLDHSSWRSSTKIEALVEELEALRARPGETVKSIVFSQFVNFLDLIAWRLQKAGFVVSALILAGRCK